MKDTFHGSGKMPVSNDKVKILSSSRGISSPPYLMTRGGIPSGPGPVVGFMALTSSRIALRPGTTLSSVEFEGGEDPTEKGHEELWLYTEAK
jgi:hypothetical protein